VFKIGGTPLFKEDVKKQAVRDIMQNWEKQMSKEGHGVGHVPGRSEMRAGGDHMASADTCSDLANADGQDAEADRRGGEEGRGVREDGGARSAGGADVAAPSRRAAAAGAERGRPGGASSSAPDGPARGEASVAADGDGREPVKRKRGRPKGSSIRAGTTTAGVQRRDETAGRSSTSKKIRVEQVNNKDDTVRHEFPSVTDAAKKIGISKSVMSQLICANPNGSVNTKDGFRYRKKHSGLVLFCWRLCAVQAMQFSSKQHDVCRLSKTLTWPHPDEPLSSRVEESQRSERKRKMPGT
jgi:hypothetical protein